MTIKTRLLTSSALMICGLAVVATISIYATSSIKKSINQLTSSSTPIQIKTTELQKNIESLSGALLRLGISSDPQEVKQLTEAVDNYRKTIETIVGEIKQLSSSGTSDVDMTVFDNLHKVLSDAVGQRLANIALFKTDAANVDSSLLLVEKTMLSIRNEMNALNSWSTNSVVESVKSSDQLFGGTNTVKDIMIDMRELKVALDDLELAKTKPEVFALKQKVKILNNNIQRAKLDDQTVKEVKDKVAGINEQCVKAGDGLFALKTDMLSGKNVQEQFQTVTKQISNSLAEMSTSLGTVVDTMENKVNRNRTEVDNALAAKQKIGLIKDTVNSISVDMKSLNAKVRVLMLSDSDENYNRSVAEIKSTLVSLTQGIITARSGIAGLQQEKLLRSVNAAMSDLRKAEGSIYRIIDTQKKILDSNALVNKTVAEVKAAALTEIKAGEERVKQTAGRQETMVASVNSMVKRLSALILIVSCIVAVIGLASSISTVARINKVIQRMIVMLKDIASGEGDLSKRLDETARDEFGEAAHWFNAFLLKLNGIIATVAHNTTQLADASGKLYETAKKMMAGAGEAASQTDSLATASNEMAATSDEIARNCVLAVEGSTQADNAAASREAVVGETIKIMNRIAEQVSSGAKMVADLGKRSDQIGEIVVTIKAIADQTNLLALNAAIEAARAGEQGRGFAVVADEVRLLAEKTGGATQEISELITSIQAEIRSAVDAMEAGVAEVKDGITDADKSRVALENILKQIKDVVMQVNQIAVAAEEQTATTTDINNNIHRITQVVQETAAGAQESASASSQVAGFAEDLLKLVRQFKLTGS